MLVENMSFEGNNYGNGSVTMIIRSLELITDYIFFVCENTSYLTGKLIKETISKKWDKDIN